MRCNSFIVQKDAFSNSDQKRDDENSIQIPGSITLTLTLQVLHQLVDRSNRQQPTLTYNDMTQKYLSMILPAVFCSTSLRNLQDSHAVDMTLLSQDNERQSTDPAIIKAIHGEEGNRGKPNKSSFSSTWMDIVCDLTKLKNQGIDLLGLIKKNFSSYEEWVDWVLNLQIPYNRKEILEAVFYVMWWLVWSFRNTSIFSSSVPSKAKQTALAISTTEAEYLSTKKACQQALWMKQALIDYDICLDNIPIMCDNKRSIDLSKNPVEHSRTKHIKIRYHFLRDNIQKENISIEKVPSKDNIADILTKPLKREPFNYLRLDAMTMKMDDQYKELQSHSKQPAPDHNNDNTPLSREEEAKFMQTF
ncbi:hypothetical protein Tco_0128619 [Tanacetum coccineum]